MDTPRYTVALGHTARVGKDTLAALVLERNGHFRRAFADQVKEELGAMLLNMTLTEYTRQRCWEFVESKKHLPETRLLMQAYGDGKRELIDQGYWVRCLEDDITESWAGQRRRMTFPGGGPVPLAYPVIPDVRYKNEVAWALKNWALLIDIERPMSETLPGGMSWHRSETELRPEDFPFAIVNDGTPDEMLALYDQILASYHAARNPPREEWPHKWSWRRSEDERSICLSHSGITRVLLSFAPPVVE